MSGAGFVEQEHPRNKSGEFAKKGEGGGVSAEELKKTAFTPVKVNKRINKLFLAHGMKKVSGGTNPTYYHAGSNTKIVIHPSAESTQSSKWEINGVTKGEGIKSLQKALAKVLNLTAEQSAAAEKKSMETAEQSDPVDFHQLVSQNGYSAIGGNSQKTVYQKGAAKVQIEPDGSWIAQTPGHMTKEGKGAESLGLLMSAAPSSELLKAGVTNSSKSVYDPEAEKKQAEAKEKQALSHKLAHSLVEHRSEPTQEQRHAIQSYTGAGYKHINDELRHEGKITPTVKKIDEWLDQCKLPEMTVYRKVSGDYSKVLKSVIFQGSMFMDRGFVSTSINEGTWSGDFHFKINIPKGAKGAYVGSGISQHPGEHEVILPRESKFLVKSFNMGSKNVELDLVV